MDIARYLRGIRAVVVELVDIARDFHPALKRERFASGWIVSRRDGKPLRTWTEQELRAVIGKRPPDPPRS